VRARPLTLRQANKYVQQYHRHHKESRGHRFSISAERDGALCGVCIVGRPVARNCDPERIAEVVRLCTDGTKNACSFLYAASARACAAMGFEKIQTYILESEDGTSLKAAGWAYEYTTRGGSWNRPSRAGRREDQPQEPKQLWSKVLG
jgi:hypothetical protein